MTDANNGDGGRAGVVKSERVDVATGTFACPICGDAKPHHHTRVVVDAYQNKRARK